MVNKVKNIATVYLVGSAAFCHNEFKALNKFFGAYLSKEKAQMAALSENEMGDIVVEGRRYRQQTMVVPVEVSYNRSLEKVWLVWSFGVAMDGSGMVATRLECAYNAEYLADKIYDQLPEGEIEVNGTMFRIKKHKLQLDVQ